jgi:hypothetical protein
MDGQFRTRVSSWRRSRLITIGIEVGGDGRPLLRDVHLTGDDGQVYYDQHRIFRWGFGSDLEPGRQLYFDLLYPGPPVRWAVQRQ